MDGKRRRGAGGAAAGRGEGGAAWSGARFVRARAAPKPASAALHDLERSCDEPASATERACGAQLARYLAVIVVASHADDALVHGAMATHRCALVLAESQLQRQASSLVTNTVKQSTGQDAAGLIARHRQALGFLVDAPSEPLTYARLCEAHRLLCTGEDHATPPGELRTRVVRVGKRHCPTDSLLPRTLPVLALCARLLRRVRERSVEPSAAAAAAMNAITHVHPFQDGNGRLGRACANWVLAAAGVPFTVALCSMREQRTQMVDALTSDYDAHSTSRSRQSVAEHCARAWAELERLEWKERASVQDAEQDAAVRRAREEMRAAGCMICLEPDANIATLCCGAPVHLRCLTLWLAAALQPCCVQCRAELPGAPLLPPPAQPPARPPVRRQRIAADDPTTTDAGEDEDETSETMDAQVQPQDDTVTVDADQVDADQDADASETTDAQAHHGTTTDVESETTAAADTQARHDDTTTDVESETNAAADAQARHDDTTTDVESETTAAADTQLGSSGLCERVLWGMLCPARRVWLPAKPDVICK
ncbi:hypothetical protein T492DRAFT_1119875, partial [Pavlovales sp. CCMP2436]